MFWLDIMKETKEGFKENFMKNIEILLKKKKKQYGSD